jgi:rhodanese-related sulfurtransferase
MKSIDANALAQWLADSQRPAPQLVDVREPWECAVCSIAGSEAIPMRSLPGEMSRIDARRPVVCICHHGQRSAYAAIYLSQQGIDVYNLSGGIDAWARQVDTAMPKY